MRGAVAAALLALAGCRDAAVAVSPAARAEIVPATVALVVGQSEQMVAMAEGLGVPRGDVLWRVVPSGLASVSSTGQLRALAEGEGIIEARAQAAPDLALGTAPLRVQPASACLLRVAASAQAVTMRPGDQRRLTARVESCDPAVAVDSAVRFEVVDSAVASVDAEGRVTGRQPGITTVLARARAVPRLQAAVHLAVVCVTPVRLSLTVAPLSATIVVGDTLRLRPRLELQSATCLPDAVAAGLHFATADSAVIQLRRDGLLTGRRSGQARVTVSSTLLPTFGIAATVLVREP